MNGKKLGPVWILLALAAIRISLEVKNNTNDDDDAWVLPQIN